MPKDTYTEFANTPIGKKLTGALGLPQPARLRRYSARGKVVEGPVVVLGNSAVANDTAELLLSWDLDVRRHADPQEKVEVVVVCLDDVQSPADLQDDVLQLSGLVKKMRSSGRVVTVSRNPEDTVDPGLRSGRTAVQGMLRSLAHELRYGATANGIILSEAIGADAPGYAGALRFFLSGRSAFVDGQFLHVSSTEGAVPLEWSRPLAGCVAVVTGAARGIGRAIAETLHRDGASVIVVDVPAAGEQLAGVANAINGTALQLDITADDAAQRILEHAEQYYGALDIVVHNAGITRDKLLANMDEARWASVIAVNIESQLKMNRVFLASPLFTEKTIAGGPRIVSLASTSGIAGNRGQSNYAASKAGVMGMVAATASELAEYHGTINAVAPGFIETEMTAKIPFATREVARRLNSLNQGGLPQDVAETIAFLASASAGGTSGITLRVCGQNLVGA